jgi:C_GCAxxG_C_C family probable redox protein
MMNHRDLVTHYFLRPGNTYGCAETTYIVLKHLFGLPDVEDSSAAMVFNGGFAYSGGLCGALTGAALAVGQLAERSLADHAIAKRQARHIIINLKEQFTCKFGSSECRILSGYDFPVPDEHEQFIEAGKWKQDCTDQILFVVEYLSDISITCFAESKNALPLRGQTQGR